MDRRALLGALAAAPLALSTRAAAPADRPQRRPNVVLIMADDMYRTAMSGTWHLSHLHIRGKEQLDFRSARPFWDTKATWLVVRPNDPGYYYTDAITDHAARTIAERARAAAVPFFHHVAFTAPHWPLHALHEGGVSTPLIARWPRVVRRRGAVSHEVGHAIDVMRVTTRGRGGRTCCRERRVRADAAGCGGAGPRVTRTV